MHTALVCCPRRIHARFLRANVNTKHKGALKFSRQQDIAACDKTRSNDTRHTSTAHPRCVSGRLSTSRCCRQLKQSHGPALCRGADCCRSQKHASESKSFQTSHAFVLQPPSNDAYAIHSMTHIRCPLVGPDALLQILFSAYLQILPFPRLYPRKSKTQGNYLYCTLFNPMPIHFFPASDTYETFRAPPSHTYAPKYSLGVNMPPVWTAIYFAYTEDLLCV